MYPKGSVAKYSTCLAICKFFLPFPPAPRYSHASGEKKGMKYAVKAPVFCFYLERWKAILLRESFQNVMIWGNILQKKSSLSHTLTCVQRSSPKRSVCPTYLPKLQLSILSTVKNDCLCKELIVPDSWIKGRGFVTMSESSVVVELWVWWWLFFSLFYCLILLQV